MKRIALLGCLVAVLVIAMATPAFAQPDGTSGTVYGKAVLAPYAIVISGGGTDPGNPLTYQGTLGQWVYEMYDTQVTVQNVGTQDAQIKIEADQLPTDGISTWDLTIPGDTGADRAMWSFGGPSGVTAVLEGSNPYFSANSTLDSSLGAGESTWFDNVFQFPTTSSSNGDHYMSATISAVAPY